MKTKLLNLTGLRSLLLLACMMLGMSAWGETTATFEPSDFSGQGTSGTGDAISATVDGVTFACDKAFGTTQIRCYKDGKITISSNKTITAIAFTFSGTYTGGLETSYTDLSTNSWEQTLSSQARLTKIVVTCSDGSTPPTCSTPKFTPAEGNYSQAQKVTISCSTENSTIYYTLDGNDPTTSSSVYSSPITISKTTTVKAIATASGFENSSVASATYTITTPLTIAAAREQGTGDVFTKGIVTSCVGTTGYIQDATAAICVYGKSLTVGDEITVSGTLSTYKGLLEITSPVVDKLKIITLLIPLRPSGL